MTVTVTVTATTVATTDDTTAGPMTSSTGATSSTGPLPGTTTSTDGSTTSMDPTTSSTSSTSSSSSSSSGGPMACAMGAGCVADEEVCDEAAMQCVRLYACDAFGAEFDRLNVTNFSVLSSVVLSDPGGGVVGGCTGLAHDPIGGELFMIATDGGGQNRRLATVDPSTGTVTIIGPVADLIAGIAFDSAGVLHGLTGQFNAMTPNAVYSIDTATGGLVLEVDVGEGAPMVLDGETIAYHPVTDLLYRWSGNGDPKLFTSIDVAMMVENVLAPSMVPAGEVIAGVNVPGGPLQDSMLISTRSNEAISVQADGTYTNEGSFAPVSQYYKGLAFSPN